jgi:hypothetical protein
MVTANPHGDWEAHCERMQQEADESLARSGHREQADDGPIAEGWQLTVGHGHSGFGIYAHMEECPEEGAIFWRSLNDVQTDAYAEGRKDEAEEHDVGRLIDAWVAAHGKPMPWAKAVEIVVIAKKLPDAERARLLTLGEGA